MNGEGVIHRDLSVVRNCKDSGHKGLGNFEEYPRSLLMKQAIIWHEGLSGRKRLRDLVLELAKLFNSNRREIRVPEYRRVIKYPNTTQLAMWAHKPHSQVSKTVFGF
jgi:hypothetical protein